MIKINASEVSALIGEHPYRSPESVFNKPEDNDFDIDPTVLSRIITSKSSDELEQSIYVLDKHVEEEIIKAAKGEDTSLKVDKSVKEAVTTLLKANPGSDPRKLEVVNNFINKSVAAAESTAMKERGKQLEDVSTDRCEATIGAPIRNRNAKCYIYRGNGYIIAGRVDGLTDKAVIETKTRRRFWNTVPKYDIIQLRCYMKMCSRTEGYINEQFPDGSGRQTLITWDDAEWNRITARIEEAIKKLKG